MAITQPIQTTTDKAPEPTKTPVIVPGPIQTTPVLVRPTRVTLTPPASAVASPRTPIFPPPEEELARPIDAPSTPVSTLGTRPSLVDRFSQGVRTLGGLYLTGRTPEPTRAPEPVIRPSQKDLDDYSRTRESAAGFTPRLPSPDRAIDVGKRFFGGAKDYLAGAADPLVTRAKDTKTFLEDRIRIPTEEDPLFKVSPETAEKVHKGVRTTFQWLPGGGTGTAVGEHTKAGTLFTPRAARDIGIQAGLDALWFAPMVGPIAAQGLRTGVRTGAALSPKIGIQNIRQILGSSVITGQQVRQLPGQLVSAVRHPTKIPGQLWRSDLMMPVRQPLETTKQLYGITTGRRALTPTSILPGAAGGTAGTAVSPSPGAPPPAPGTPGFPSPRFGPGSGPGGLPPARPRPDPFSPYGHRLGVTQVRATNGGVRSADAIGDLIGDVRLDPRQVSNILASRMVSPSAELTVVGGRSTAVGGVEIAEPLSVTAPVRTPIPTPGWPTTVTPRGPFQPGVPFTPRRIPPGRVAPPGEPSPLPGRPGKPTPNGVPDGVPSIPRVDPGRPPGTITQPEWPRPPAPGRIAPPIQPVFPRTQPGPRTITGPGLREQPQLSPIFAPIRRTITGPGLREQPILSPVGDEPITTPGTITTTRTQPARMFDPVPERFTRVGPMTQDIPDYAPIPRLGGGFDETPPPWMPPPSTPPPPPRTPGGRLPGLPIPPFIGAPAGFGGARGGRGGSYRATDPFGYQMRGELVHQIDPFTGKIVGVRRAGARRIRAGRAAVGKGYTPTPTKRSAQAGRMRL